MSEHPFQEYIAAQLPPDLLPPQAPMLLIRQTDPELKHRDRLNRNLRDLSKFSQEFSEAVALFDLSRSQQELGEADPVRGRRPGNYSFMKDIWRGWTFIAARQGAVTVRNFGVALREVRRAAKETGSWTEKIDLIAIRQIKKDFDQTFPNIVDLRDGISHPEVYSDPDKDVSASKFPDIGLIVLGEGSSATVQSSLSGRTLVSTWKHGLVVQVEISRKNAELLIELTRKCYAAVAKISIG